MREVSCRAPAILLEVLSAAGIDVAPLVVGLPVTLEELRDPTRRIDWDVFSILADRVADASTGVLTLEEIGSRVLVVPSFAFLRRAGQLLVAPSHLYGVAARIFVPALFTNLVVRQTPGPGGRLIINGQLAPGFRGSTAFFRICNGNVVALPRLMDLAPATIEEQSVTPTGSRLVIVIPPSHTIGTKLLRGARAVMALGDAYRGVIQQQLDLEASAEAVRSSRREFRQLLERLPEGVLIHRDGVVRWANAAMLATLGYQSLDLVVGKNVLDFLSSEERPAVSDQVANAMPRQITDARPEYRIVRPDGTQRRVQAGAAQYVDFEEAPARLVVVSDVTESHHLQEQLALADRMASIGTVAAGVAHEINNPLAYVHASLEVAARELGAVSETTRIVKIRDCIQRGLEGTERVRGIVRNLKTLSRAEEEPLEGVDLPALLDSTLVLAAKALSAKAKMVRRYGPVPLAHGTEGRLGQVFLNLLLNAADAIPDDGKPNHEVCVTTTTDAAGRAVVEIADTGIGIPGELAPRVFDPFFTTKAVGTGTGLGLPICHRLVTELGGDISFAPAPHGGTIFRVVLLPAETARITPHARMERPRLRGRVLIVDDERALLQSLCVLLGDVHEVVGKSSAREALDLLREDREFDAVLADLMMVNLTGMDLYDAVRDAHPGLERRFVFMTGGVFTARGREFLAQVPNRCIEKPFTEAELLAALGELIPGDVGDAASSPSR